MRSILGAYSSVPNEALFVLARSLPVHIHLESIKAITELKRIGSTTLFGEEIQIKVVDLEEKLENW